MQILIGFMYLVVRSVECSPSTQSLLKKAMNFLEDRNTPNSVTSPAYPAAKYRFRKLVKSVDMETGRDLEKLRCFILYCFPDEASRVDLFKSQCCLRTFVSEQLPTQRLLYRFTHPISPHTRQLMLLLLYSAGSYTGKRDACGLYELMCIVKVLNCLYKFFQEYSSIVNGRVSNIYGQVYEAKSITCEGEQFVLKPNDIRAIDYVKFLDDARLLYQAAIDDLVAASSTPTRCVLTTDSINKLKVNLVRNIHGIMRLAAFLMTNVFGRVSGFYESMALLQSQSAIKDLSSLKLKKLGYIKGFFQTYKRIGLFFSHQQMIIGKILHFDIPIRVISFSPPNIRNLCNNFSQLILKIEISELYDELSRLNRIMKNNLEFNSAEYKALIHTVRMHDIYLRTKFYWDADLLGKDSIFRVLDPVRNHLKLEYELERRVCLVFQNRCGCVTKMARIVSL